MGAKISQSRSESAPKDPFAHYYYGIVLKLTARTLGEKQRALNEFALAVQYDRRKASRSHTYIALSR